VYRDEVRISEWYTFLMSNLEELGICQSTFEKRAKAAGATYKVGKVYNETREKILCAK